MQTLLVDNYDSYTHNLAELITLATGREPLIIMNDELTAAAALSLPVDCVVLSPGPGSPDRSRDVGICRDLLRHTRLPVLGVCLGHQLIAHEAGAAVVCARHPAHGVVSRVDLADDELFRAMPRTIDAVRYHSLALATPLPPALRQIATAADGTVMAVRRTDRPQWGVQFHPEALCTPDGEQILRNFHELTVGRPRVRAQGAIVPPARLPGQSAPAARSVPVRKLAVIQRELRCGNAGPADPLAVYQGLYKDAARSFWLDTNAPRATHGWSFMGAATGELDHLITARGNGITTTASDGRTKTQQVDSVWAHLQDRLEGVALQGQTTAPFQGGYVGYLGYALPTSRITVARPATELPDLALLFVSRFLAFEHGTGRVFACAVHPEDDDAAARSWLDETEARLAALPAASDPHVRDRGGDDGDIDLDTDIDPDRLARALDDAAIDPRDEYERKVRACKAEIERGEAYEICLTTGFGGPALRDAFAVYRALRTVNPAPYSCYVDFGAYQVLSSSPERFLRVSADGAAETRPIKGTAARHPDPGTDAAAAAALARDPKCRAENMMIVDLLRNDLNSVCEVGTVAVDSLMHVESYQTVHQLVSAISGRLAPGRTPLAAIERCFPGGSMTGAPKLRAMEIISELEQHGRGAYAGALGVLSLDGYVDLSIVIRTIVNDPRRWFVGAGGAVLLDSDPAAEYEEMRQKAAPALTAILAAHARTGR